MPVLSDEDVGLSPSYLSDEDVGLVEDEFAGGETLSPEELARDEKLADEFAALKQERKKGGFAANAATAIGGAMEVIDPIAVTPQNRLGAFGTAAKGLGHIAGYTGQVGKGVVQDLRLGNITGLPATSQALSTGRAPELEPTSLPARIIEGAGQGIGTMVPAIAATAVGVPPMAAYPTVMGSQAYQETGGDLKATAQAALLGAVLPAVSSVAKAAAGKAIVGASRYVPKLAANPVLSKSVEEGASQIAQNAVAGIVEAPELMALYKEDPNKFYDKAAEMIGVNLAMGAHDIMGIANPNVRSQSGREIADLIRPKVPEMFTPPERGGIPEPVRPTTGEPNVIQEPGRKAQPATEATKAVAETPTPGDTQIRAVEPQVEVQGGGKELPAVQQAAAVADKSKWTKATEFLKTPEGQAAAESRPTDWSAFYKVDEQGNRSIDPKGLQEGLRSGKLVASPEASALLSHLLETSDLHPLESITPLEFTPDQAGLITGEASGFAGRQRVKEGGRESLIDLVMKQDNGESVSQADFVHVVTHELLHNNLSSKFRDAPELQKQTERLLELARTASKGTEMEGHYGLSRASDLLSEMSNPEFKKWLNSVKDGDRNLYQRIIAVFQKLFRLPDKMRDAFGREVDSGSALESLIDVASKLDKTRRTATSSKAAEFSKAGEKADKLPPVPEGHVRMFHGEGGPQGGGKGGSFYTSSAEKAATFGPDVSWVDVPADKAQAAREAARKSGQGGDTALLTKEDAAGARPIAGKSEAKVYDLDEPAGDFQSAIKEAEKIPNEELIKLKGGPTGAMWDLGAKAKDVGDVAALKSMAEESNAKISALAKEGKIEEAMALAGRQPAEAYEFATGVKLDGTPKWEMFEKRRPGYVPAVPDAKYVAAKGETAKVSPVAAPAPSGASESGASTQQPTSPSQTPTSKESLQVEPSKSQKWTGATEESPSTPISGQPTGLSGQLYAGIPNPAAVVAGIKKAVADFGPGVKAAGKVVSDAVRDIYKENLNIRKMDDLSRSVLNWSGKLQRSFGEASSAQKEIQRVAKSKVQDEGLTNWMEAGGDKAKLTVWRDGTTDPKLRAGYEAALNLSPAEVQKAQEARGAYDQLFDRAERWGLVDKDPSKPSSFRDDYVTHLWNLGRGSFAGGARTLKDQFRFAKARTFANYFEGEQAGMKPKTKRLSQLLPVYLHEMNSVIAARQLVKQMGDGKASDGRPLLAVRGKAETVSGVKGEAVLVRPDAPIGDTADYRALENQPALHDWFWAGKDTQGNPVFEKSDLVLHPEAYKKLKAILGKSKIRNWYETKTTATMEIPKAIAKGLDMFQSETKRTMLGAISPFHQVQEGTHAVGHKINPFANPFGLLDPLNKKLPAALRFGVEKPNLENPVHLNLAKKGLMILPDRASERNFTEGLRPSGLVSFIPGIGRLADHYSNYLFHEYIPGLKIKTALAIIERNKKVYAKELASGEVSLEDVELLSTTQTNAAYGHLNYADLGRDPTIQHILQLGLLAPDFLEARAKFTGQGLKGLTGAKVGREQLLALATLAVGQAALSWTMAQLTDGEWEASHPFEFKKDNRRYMLRSVPEDLVRLVTDSRAFLYNRINPITAKVPWQMATGRDWRGQKITVGETLKEAAKAPIPLTARGFMGVDKSPLKDWEQLAGAVGLKIMRYSPQNEVGKMFQDWKSKSENPKLVAEAEQDEAQTFAPSIYSDLRQALEKDDWQAGSEAYNKLMETKTPAQVKRVMNPTSVDPGTGASRDRLLPKKLEREFLGSLSDEDREVYEDAKRHRKLMYQRFQRLLKGD